MAGNSMSLEDPVMARIALTIQTPDADGMTVTFGAVSAAAAPDGNYFDTDGSRLLLVKNDAGAPITVTVDVNVAIDGVAVADRTLTVPAGAIVAWRPKDVHRQATGQVHLNFSSATSVTAAVIEV